MNTIKNKKILIDISGNTIQVIATQFFGLLIFYFTSKYLSKNEFGDLNWSTALASTVIALASLGLDLVFVKRVAQGLNISIISGIHFFHTLLSGLIFSAIIFGISFLLPSFTVNHPIFFLIFLNVSLANVANSFKLCLTGLESFKQLAVLSLLTNGIKFLLIILLFIYSIFSIYNVVIVYISSSVFEFIIGYYFVSKNLQLNLKPRVDFNEYKLFIKESLPQLGVVIFDSALARIDWLLLGILSTSIVTAEYSFVYKVFELSKLPILILAPLLLTRFSRLFNSNKLTETKIEEVNLFFKLEVFIIMFIPIILVTCWSPLIDYFTDNKYGKVNEINYLLLALCIPLTAIINFLWTMGFVQGQLKTIMFITIFVSLINIIGNIILIPLLGSTGSSITFLVSTILQLFLYVKYIKQQQIQLKLLDILKILFLAVLAILASKFLIYNIIFVPIVAVFIYIFLFFITQQINWKQINQFKK